MSARDTTVAADLTDLRQLRAQYERHLVDDVLAWWLRNGPDAEHGGVLTCWDNSGTHLVSTDKYTWSQGRWAWLTSAVAAATESGALDADPAPYREQALATATFVRDHALLPDGTTAYVTDRGGRPLEPKDGGGAHRSVFADLFAALGFAGAARLTGTDEWAERAETLLLSARNRIEQGTFRSEPYPVPEGHRSLALPMILVGVGEQVHRASASAESANVVRSAAAQIHQHFLVDDDVHEMPAVEAAGADTLLASHRTPGHVLEALWFLHHARDLLPASHPWQPDVLADVAVRACRSGWDDECGGLMRYVDAAGGEPTGRRTGDGYEDLVVRTWDTKLWWPHAEALYTTALLAESTGRQDLLEWHRRLHRYTFTVFPDGPGREWTQTRDRQGQPLNTTVALPVKDPFHVARALLLLVQLLGAAPTGEREMEGTGTVEAR